MKTILLFILSFVVIECSGQRFNTSVWKMYDHSYTPALTIREPVTYMVVIINDTLLIENTGNFKFIKIGERIYKIESPKLIEVNSPTDWWLKKDSIVYLGTTYYFPIKTLTTNK